jgi:hypothetical protein
MQSRKKDVVAHLKDYREALEQVRRLFPELPLTPLCFFESWTDVAITSLTERAKITPDPAKPPALFEAAEFFGLHLGNPAEEALLLHILADVVFGGRKKGRPRTNKGKWDAVKLIQLAIDCNKIKEDTA